MDIRTKLKTIEIFLTGAVLLSCAALVKFFNIIKTDINNQRLSVLIIFCVVLLILIFILILIENTRRQIIRQAKQIRDNLESIINEVYDDVAFTYGKADVEYRQICIKIEALKDRVIRDSIKQKEDEQFIRTSIVNISHDLKTPLSSIRGYAEGLLDGVADTEEKRLQYTRMIINKVNTITSLLSELSYYSSIDTDGVLDVILPVNVKEYFDDCADEISQDLNAKHIGFEYSNTVSDNAEFCVDVEKISKAVKNMIGNSVKFVEYETGIISLVVEEKNGFIMACIKDNGAGIPADKLPHIFKRYFKADDARNGARSGSGIGLSIVKKIIDDHGGEISVSSVEGKGTQISFKLKKYSGDIR